MKVIVPAVSGIREAYWRELFRLIFQLPVASVSCHPREPGRLLGGSVFEDPQVDMWLVVLILAPEKAARLHEKRQEWSRV